MYEVYLKLVDFCNYKYFLKLLMDSYVILYSEGRIVSLFVRGYYLYSIIIKNNMVGFNDVIRDYIRYG